MATLPPPFVPPQCLAYVPLHSRRKRSRGFNQSYQIAWHLAEYFQVPLDERLRRSRSTRAQMSLTSPAERERNITNAFNPTPGYEPIKTPVILIDDIATTLTTLRECASVLKSEGAPTVYAVTVAG